MQLISCISYLLQLRAETQDLEFTELKQKVDRIYTTSSYIYNEKVMLSLIQNGFFYELFCTEQCEDRYAKLMVHFLLGNNIDIKKAVVIHIMKKCQVDVLSDNIQRIFCEMTSPLFILLEKSFVDDREMCSLVSGTLLTMVQKYKDAKNYIMKEYNAKKIN